jgi:hypothetical protein
MSEHHAPLRSRRAFLQGVFTGLAGIALACLPPHGNRNQAAAAARPRTRLDRGPKYIADVRHFGAKGDGITDDAKAFQDAVDSLVNSGGVVWAPPGKIYALGSTVTIKSKHSIWIVSDMSGPDKGLIRPKKNPGYLFEWDKPEGLTWFHGGGGGVEGLRIADSDSHAEPSYRSKLIEGALRVNSPGWSCIDCSFECPGGAIRR